MTDEARELLLYIENDGDLYRQQFTPILKNLTAKKARGIYEHDKAVKLFLYLVESGAKKYAKEFGGTWNLMFSIPARKSVAESLTESFEVEYRNGAFKSFVPKKYQ